MMTRVNVPKVRIDLSRPTGNFWIDTGTVVLVQGLGEGEYPVEDVLQWLLRRLVRRTKYCDETREQFCEYEEKSWVYPVNLFIKVREFELKLDLRKKPGVCDLCSDEAPLTDAKMWMFPFVVDPDKFGNFYSGAKRGLRLCARCALAGLAGYLGWLWKAQGRDALHFFVFHSGLREMERLHREVLEPLRMQGDNSGNFQPAFSGNYIHETTLGLLLALFAHVQQSDQLSEESRLYLAALLGAAPTDTPLPPITIYAVAGEPGQAFRMKALWEFTKLQQLYRLYEHWLEVIARNQIDVNPHQRVVQVLRQFEAQQGNKWESFWRDKIAWAILEFGDPLPFVERFLFEVRAREQVLRPLVRGTLDILNQYVQEVLGMNEQFWQSLARFGRDLGEKAHNHNKIGLLYALRNARNPEDFYRALSDAQFRLEVTIPEVLLGIEKGERIAGVSWARVKTLLSIYAMNAYLRKRASGLEDSQTREEE